MLKLRDFLHLPQIDTLVGQLVTDEPGLILLAGIEARPAAQAGGDVFRASGLSAIFNILLQEILLANLHDNAIVIGEDRALARVPRQLSRRVRFVHIEPPYSYPQQIELATIDHPGLIVIDKIREEALPAIFRAAQSGMRVLSHFDTVLRGPAVARQLVEIGVTQDQLPGLRWIITNQRMSLLCEKCKQPVDTPEDMLDRLGSRYPHMVQAIEESRKLISTIEESDERKQAAQAQRFSRAGGCERCHGGGYSGDIGVFDFFRNDPKAADFFAQRSLISMEEYAFHLAQDGMLDLNDVLNAESEHLRRTYQMLTASERALSESNSTLNRKLVELEASNRVLVQRTEVLMSLQDLGQALITSVELSDLATRVCRRAGDLCGADRVVLYLRRQVDDQPEEAEILAERGWGLKITGSRVEGKLVFGQPGPGRPEMHSARYVQVPPGFRTQGLPQGDASKAIKTGVRVPLVAQDVLVGVMVIQSTQKEFFTQGEIALLQTFANQAALAIQRTGLVNELRAKIHQLEAAQVELVKKERMEHELELARQVQRSMLPHSFPQVQGFLLFARYEPARQVGGDFYDVFHLDDDHFGVVIADVSDKGLPAALYMALTRSLILAEARRTLSPRSALLNVNRLLLELGEMGGFVSVFYGIVECSSARMTYTRAGHERPLILRNHKVQSLGGSGAVLGTLDNDLLNLSEEQVDLKPNDRLVLYTDGITDDMDAQGKFFSLPQFEKLLRLLSDKDGDELCDDIFAELLAYRGQAEQFDDMTLFVLEVK